MRPAAVSCLLAVLIVTSTAAVAAESVWKRRAQRSEPTASGPPPAGEYKCFLIGMGGSIVTPYGASATTTPMPSAINRVTLDGKGSYKHASGSGRYRYEQDGAMIFASGPLQGWTSRSETDGAKQWLRFAAKVGASLAATSSIGDHICSVE
jgi:hypothetical protein